MSSLDETVDALAKAISEVRVGDDRPKNRDESTFNYGERRKRHFRHQKLKELLTAFASACVAEAHKEDRS